MNIHKALSTATSQLSEQTTPQLDAEVLLSHLLNKERSWIMAHGDFELSDQQNEAFENLIARRTKHEPVAYIVGQQDFYGRGFVVTPAVMIPRPETELIIDLLKTDFVQDSKISIADIGTGSGNLGIPAALEFSNAKVIAVDVDDKALDVAQQNKIKLDAHNVVFNKSDLLDYFIENNSKLDAILANLPYLTQKDIDESPTKEDLSFEPQTALLADDEGLALIKKCSKQAVDILKDNGKIYFEMLPHQTGQFAKWIGDQKLPYSTNIFKDLAGKDRVVVLTKKHV